MVAYSFQKQFALPILEGTKGGTVRAGRVRPHAGPGDELQLYSGMRTKHCRLIARKTCLARASIWLGFRENNINVALDGDSQGGIEIRKPRAIDAFARFDGFADWDQMRGFWRDDEDPHRADYFAGWHIRWAALPIGDLT